jgi:hypothetical protein
LLFKVLGLFDVFAFRIATGMNKSVHIDVEIVAVRISGLERLKRGLDSVSNDLGVAHAKPFEEYGYSHCEIL